MKSIESGDPTADVRLEQPEPPIYLPGTPTVSFLEYVELLVGLLRR